MYRLMAVFFVLAFLTCNPAQADGDKLGLGARQMIVCLAPRQSSFEGTLQLFSRDASGKWQADSRPWPVLFAPKGLAWGRGINPPQAGPQKTSNDHRNPAGLFKVGFALGYAPTLPPGAHGWPYHQVTNRDAWIDDPTVPEEYNHLYTLPPGAPLPPWWEKERLHLGDNAYQWMVLIEHNYDQPVANAGTLIFFHIRRGEHYRTAGCTTMRKEDLERLIKWLQPGSNALLAELARDDYTRVWNDWHLPPPEIALGKN
jgi:L,D-peptidoglycan transpeptidase YkuD (ErfK/YbiS/YcfS/YnhG family)